MSHNVHTLCLSLATGGGGQAHPVNEPHRQCVRRGLQAVPLQPTTGDDWGIISIAFSIAFFNAKLCRPMQSCTAAQRTYGPHASTTTTTTTTATTPTTTTCNPQATKQFLKEDNEAPVDEQREFFMEHDHDHDAEQGLQGQGGATGAAAVPTGLPTTGLPRLDLLCFMAAANHELCQFCAAGWAALEGYCSVLCCAGQRG